MTDGFSDVHRNPPLSRLLIFASKHFPLRLFRFFEAIVGADIPHRLTSDVRFPHIRGVVIHQRAVIGDGTLIYQNVTIGSKYYWDAPPTIGRQVVVGANAVLLGTISIGDSAIVAAGSVVLQDVPPGVVVAGNPARVVGRRAARVPGGSEISSQ